MASEDMRAQVLRQCRERGMFIWSGYAADRYWCHYGITPPPLPPTWRTTAYPDESVVVDLGEKFMPPVDQLTYANMLRLKEEEEEVNFSKFLNHATIRRRYSHLSKYCAICSESPPAGWDVWKDGEPLFSSQSHGWQPTRHNHTSTRYRRIDAETDDWGRIQCLECGPEREWHHIKQGERHLICVTSSCLNNWMTAQIHARQDFKGTDIHIDWEGISGANVRDLLHAIRAVYGRSAIPVDVLVAAGSNDIIQGRSIKDIIRDLNKFKAMVLEIAPRHYTGKSTFAVCTPPHPPAHTKYGQDNHHEGKRGRDLYNREFLELTERIVEFNQENARKMPGVEHAPLFHRFGVHHKKNTARDLYNLASIPSHHRYDEWREPVREEMKHLAEHKRVQMGMAVVSYFKQLHNIRL